MNPQLNRFLGFLAATAALGLVVAVLGGRLLRGAGGADGAIITHLKRLEQRGVVLQLPFGELRAAKLQFQRISVVLDADGQGALVSSTLDLTGSVARTGAPPTQVSSLGLERARYLLDDGDWRPAENDLPRLVSILRTLEERRAALEVAALPDGGEPFPGLHRRSYRSLGWFIRSEREDVTVAEDYQLRGDTAERPVDEKGTKRLSLVEDSAGFFSFPDGIL